MVDTGWADDRLMQACDLIHAVLEDYEAAEFSHCLPELKALLAGLESADTVLAAEIAGSLP